MRSEERANKRVDEEDDDVLDVVSKGAKATTVFVDNKAAKSDTVQQNFMVDFQ